MPLVRSMICVGMMKSAESGKDKETMRQKALSARVYLRSRERRRASSGVPGAISSRSDPTAEKATIASTPMLLSAAMLARALTSEGGMLCETPWREMKATSGPGTLGASAVGGSVKIESADEGVPQGWRTRRRETLAGQRRCAGHLGLTGREEPTHGLDVDLATAEDEPDGTCQPIEEPSAPKHDMTDTKVRLSSL
jgi:hypothetical protein